MRKEAEPWSFPERSYELLDRVAGRIEPTSPLLTTWLESYRRQHRKRLVADLAIVERYVEPGTQVLEYGAVPLLMTGLLREMGYGVRALDVAPERFAASIAELGLDVRKCDVETEPVPFGDRLFDAVLFNELFEHLRIDPIFTLREAHRVLRPDGLLLLSTPNLRSFRGLRNLLLHHRGHASSGNIYHQYEKLHTLGHMGHVREYTTREVAEFLSQIGFRVEAVLFRGGHGAGLVGLAERLAPSLRPFFTLVARRRATLEPGDGRDSESPE